MKTKFLIFIIAVLVSTIGFGLLILRQLKIFEKNVLAAKQRKAEYLRQQSGMEDSTVNNHNDPAHEE